jgi:restriction endonuclease S subunit
MATVNRVQRSRLDLSARIDAEHYSPRFVPVLSQLAQLKTVKLRRTLSEPVKTGHTPSTKNSAYYNSDVVKFVKTDNLREDRIDTDNVQFLSELGNSEIAASELRADDVIVTIIGATEEIIGRAARIHDDLGRANINQNVALIRSRIPAGYLTVFLNSHYGREQLIWLSRQTGQVNLNCREVEELSIPLFSDKFIASIHDLNNQRHRLLFDSAKIYSQAEQLLLSEIGLQNWKPSHTLTYVKNYSQTVQTQRMDAEHFQPKFDEIAHYISAYNPQRLSKLATQIFETVNFDEQQKYRYIEISDVNTSNGEVGYTEREVKDLPPNAKIKVKGGELIVSKVRPTRGAIGIVPDECRDNGVCSSAFVVLDIPSPTKEFLQVYLRSVIGKALLEQPCKGTSYPTIDDIDVKALPIPMISNQVQEKISELVSQSRLARREAKIILEKAKRAVVIAIEENEKLALESIG